MIEESVHPSTTRKEYSWPALIASTLALLWAAHGVVLFAHEYAHSFAAWALGWKRNPFALNYAHPTVTVLLIQLGISQNVDEVPIFASGHGPQAALISAAGAVLGNALITFPLSRWLYRYAKRQAAAGWGMLAYWITVASIGNFIDYVPIRTFITGTDLDQDMYAVEKGLSWSPWTLLFVFGLPTALAVGIFFKKMEPETLRWLFPYSRGKRIFVAVLTAFLLFAFYGAAGWSGGGKIAHTMSVVSACSVAPIVAILTAIVSTSSRSESTLGESLQE